MFSRQHRFHGYNALNFVYKQGQVIRGQGLSLKYAPNTRQQSYRVAVVVSKKVSKSAVVRNRIRRRVYAAVRPYAERITQPYDLVFLVYEADYATMETIKLQKTVATQLERAKVMI